MPLEDTNRVDTAVTMPDGRLHLVITDAGITTDPEERYQAFAAKTRPVPWLPCA